MLTVGLIFLPHVWHGGRVGPSWAIVPSALCSSKSSQGYIFPLTEIQLVLVHSLAE